MPNIKQLSKQELRNLCAFADDTYARANTLGDVLDPSREMIEDIGHPPSAAKDMVCALNEIAEIAGDIRYQAVYALHHTYGVEYPALPRGASD